MTAILLINYICVMQVLSRTIDIRDAKVFEIASDDANYDEENENEMIQMVDLANVKPLVEDESRYEPLHSHVRHYNERNTKSEKQFSNVFPYLRARYANKVFHSQEQEDLVADSRHGLDKAVTRTTIIYEAIRTIKRPSFDRSKRNAQHLEKLQNRRNSTINTTGITGNESRAKREKVEGNPYGTISDEDTDFFRMARDVTIDEVETTRRYSQKMQETRATQYDTYDRETTSVGAQARISGQSLTREKSIPTIAESFDKESYDYEKFKMEYEQQLEYSVRRGEILNYTEGKESEDTPRRALEMDLKRPENCTKEEQSRVGIKAIECLIYDYQRTRDVESVKRVLLKTWLVVRVWMLIYICLAIPCWCQIGWCCCCFRCKFCFPRKRVLFAKQYYATSPPGMLIRDSKKKAKDTEEPIKYEAAKHEYDAYNTLEAAIRNM